MGKRYSGVTAFIGMPGSGKTYSLVAVAEKAMREGIPVYVNAGFKVKGAIEYRSLEEMLLIPNGSCILLDEAPTVFNSRRWQEFPDGLLYRLTQVRKDGLQLYWSAIHEDMVDVTLRRLTFWFVHCHSITKRLFYTRIFPPEEFRKQDEGGSGLAVRRVKMRVARLYDTHGKVAISRKVLERMAALAAEDWIELPPGMDMSQLLAWYRGELEPAEYIEAEIVSPEAEGPPQAAEWPPEGEGPLRALPSPYDQLQRL